MLLTFGLFYSTETLLISKQTTSNTPTSDKPLVLDFNDLPKDAKAPFEKLISEAVTRGFYRYLEKVHNITNPIEVKLIMSYHQFFDMRSREALDSIYLVKPGKRESKPKFHEFKKGSKVIIRYTCDTDEVPKPFALIYRIQVIKGKPIAEEKILYFDRDTGWRPKQ
jgi:hypothetical protein